mmetsp:Transcript_36772/g.80108  ORF Transcript_36772/g.80108 Transcript_36772/m.80108 type:complete len:276 (-) Transcript_36772:443-1270(-)
MQAYYTSQAPSSSGAYYGNAVPGTQPPHPYAMWPGQPMMPYGAAPPSFYPGTMFAHPGAQQPGAGEGGEEGEPASVDANGKPMLQAPVQGSNGVPNTSAGAGDGRGHPMGMPPMEMIPMDGTQAAAAAGQQMMPGQPLPGVPHAPGQEYWQAQAQAPHGQMAPPHVVGNSELWMDERELKRQRRKQSNRESARRSRLRKQAECEDLSARVEKLNEENSSLREELQRLKDACTTLTNDKTDLEDHLHTLRDQKVDDKSGKNAGKGKPTVNKKTDSK